MLDQPPDIPDEICAPGLRLLVGLAEDGNGLPEPQHGNQQSDHRHQEEGFFRGKMIGDVPGSERSRNDRDGADHVPQSAQAPGHELLLAHQCDQPLIGCGDKSGRQHCQQHPGDQSRV